MALAKSMPVAFVGLAFASTALAADVDLHGFGREVWLSKSSEAHVIHLKAPPALRIVVGGETLELERTTLPNLVKRFGGSIHSRGDAGDPIYWVCYNDAPTSRTLWFVSDEMGGSDKAVMAVALAADGGGDQDGCARPAAPIANVTINIPSIGDSVTDIDHAFGAKFARRSSAFLVGSEPRWIQYKLDHDKILGVAVGQSTVN